jgi:steroid delta-isomerase
MSAALERVRAFWETLTPASLARLGEVYADDAYFRDPFNEVRGAAALRRVLEHMFATLEAPAFRIVEAVEAESGAMLVWDFEFGIRAPGGGKRRRIHGVSHLRLGRDGRVTYHRDYWDAAGELYAQLPLLGPFMRFLARRFAAPAEA